MLENVNFPWKFWKFTINPFSAEILVISWFMWRTFSLSFSILSSQGGGKLTGLPINANLRGCRVREKWKWEWKPAMCHCACCAAEMRKSFKWRYVGLIVNLIWKRKSHNEAAEVLEERESVGEMLILFRPTPSSAFREYTFFMNFFHNIFFLLIC